MKCKIFIDTNPIWEDKGPFSTLFNSSLSDLLEFINKHSIKNVIVCFPEIVIRERIQHRLELINSAREYVNEKIKSLKEAGHTEEEIKPRNDYKEKLEDYAKNFCFTNKIEIIKTPDISIEEITELAINKKKPFNDHGSGFKDTLIYLSMIEDVKNDKFDVYILCTNNSKQFDQEIIDDFKEKTQKTLIILPDIISVQQKLDEIVPIGLKLEKRNEEVKKNVLNKLGDLMKEINKFNNTKSDIIDPWSFKNRYRWNLSDQVDNNDNETRINGYNFSDINFSSIEEISDDIFQVQGNIQCEIVYQEDKKNDRIGSFHNPYYSDVSISTISLYGGYGIKEYKPLKKDFNFIVNCDIKSGSIYIMNVTGGLLF